MAVRSVGEGIVATVPVLVEEEVAIVAAVAFPWSVEEENGPVIDGMVQTQVGGRAEFVEEVFVEEADAFGMDVLWHGVWK